MVVRPVQRTRYDKSQRTEMFRQRDVHTSKGRTSEDPLGEREARTHPVGRRRIVITTMIAMPSEGYKESRRRGVMHLIHFAFLHFPTAKFPSLTREAMRLSMSNAESN